MKKRLSVLLAILLLLGALPCLANAEKAAAAAPADGSLQYHVIVTSVILLIAALAFLLTILLQRGAQKKAVRETQRVEKQLLDIIQTVPCGICMYRLEDGNLRPILVNQQFKQMLGEEADEYLAGDKGIDYTHAHPDDLDRIQQEVMRGLTVTNEIDTTYRSWNPKIEKYIWMRMRGQAMPQPDGSCNIYVSYYDVTQERMAEHLADIALESSGVSIWEYDYERRSIIQYQNSAEMHGFENVIPNVPESLVESGFVHPDSAQAFLAMYEELFAGAHFAEGVFRVQTADRKGWWYEHIRYTNEFDANGKPIRAAGMSTDETEKQETTMRYQREQELKKASLAEEKLLAYALFDLTARETLECRYKGGADVPEEDRTDFAYAHRNSELLIDPKERAAFVALNDMDTLLGLFDSGETEFKLEYRRKVPEGKVIWVRNFMHLLRDPESGNVCLFQYWYDIDDEKMREMMYNSIVTSSYDFVARIDGVSRRFEVVSRTGMNFHIPPQSGDDADEVTHSMYSDYIVPEDRDAVIENSIIENVNRHLAQNERYVFTYRMTRPSGELRYKRVTQYYIDPKRKIIVMLREDVTDIIKAEAEKNLALKTALAAAEQASAAKGEFMSRMSHEIRTPLNAIIGYNTIAKNAIVEAKTDEERRQADTNAMDCLTKSELASKHLLTVINDVLDMSAIESGKIRLANERFDFKSLISALTVLFYSQAKAKGVQFDVLFDSPTEEWFLGDQMRVNQILTNLLSNAVKFTPTGGSVKMHIIPSQFDDDHMRFCFAISDTGIGMSQASIERLWQPFEQADSSISRRFGGTGLGLAITKSLVDIMDGEISVESEPGVGSVFRVELTFGRIEQPQEVGMYDFSGMHALIVDDDRSTCDYIKLLFDRFGARSEAAHSGADAITSFQTSHARNDPFTLCMVDWRMPGMDGIATVREIRKLAGGDVPIIIVTAYDYTEIADKVKDADVTMFVEKPLFQSSLFDLLSTISGMSKPKNLPKSDVVSFSGARVLLAEDNKMNMEVAKYTLQSMGLAVDSAWNGSEAVSMFENAAPGTYKLILMDVHMPDMDGYLATQIIRRSAHPDGAAIPIIAMTADAFAENVAEAYAVGMNDHIAKPVDMDILRKTLCKYIPR
ncbi:MAG: response regulator [Eubacteriales bacterium]|nr:response regulator [Eubacteriales bacterium]